MLQSADELVSGRQKETTLRRRTFFSWKSRSSIFARSSSGFFIGESPLFLLDFCFLDRTIRPLIRGDLTHDGGPSTGRVPPKNRNPTQVMENDMANCTVCKALIKTEHEVKNKLCNSCRIKKE